MSAECAYLAVGSNIEPLVNIPRALELLQARVVVCATSTFYSTEPIGRPEDPRYLNGVWCIQTALVPQALKFEILRPIEAALGRTRSADRYAARPIDLDIALFGERVVSEDDLILPDPEIRERAFLAAPLCELAPELVLPDTGEVLSTLASARITPDMEPHEELTAKLRGIIDRFTRRTWS